MIDVPVRVADALRDGTRPKNYKFYVIFDDESIDFMIDNNNLVSESVKFDERMCSGDLLKFGLCEGTSLEFQYFGLPAIRNRRIRAEIDVMYVATDDTIQTYTIPMGFYTVDKCPRQFSTGIMKVTAYNKLQSTYLDQKANENLRDMFLGDYTLSIFEIKKALLGSYQIDSEKIGVSSSLQPYGVINQYYPSFGSFTLTQTYDIDSPINPYEMGVNDTTTSFNVGAQSNIIPFYITANPNQPYYADANLGSLLGLERTVVDFYKSVINNAQLDKTWDDALDYICTHSGFNKLMGVEVVVGTTTKYYSTVQWEYEEEHGITHTVSGPLSEIAYRQYSGQISLVSPRSLTFNSVFRELYLYGVFMNVYTRQESYHYYADSQQTELVESDLPVCMFSDYTPFTQSTGEFPMWIFQYTSLPPADLITMKISEIPEFTLRDLTDAVYETVCQYGKLDRVTDLFAGVELNNSRLLPADNLYPSNNLYPDGDSERGNPSMYSKLWTDSQGKLKFKDLIITYKGLDSDNKETELTLQRTVNPDGNTDYNMSDNWIFKNIVWNAADVGTYADAMVLKMQNVSWVPFEMWCAGLPYLETGDEIEITTSEGTFTSYVLQRQLNGIQNLQDTYINGTLDVF